ncbi:MAG TPA: alpha/beta fold hydrolase [Marmoricola sp.]|nr:alpha/beta fold hydrolase [Marmoricola sp.]
MKRVVSAVCAVVVVVTLAGLHSIGGASATPSAPSTGSFTPTLAPWTTCASDGTECSRLTVPLDYANPGNGKTVSLAVTRLLASPSMTYDGIMVVNPGGPGGSGTGFAALQQYVPNKAGYHYDWIGFDPRGVGASTPALHCNPNYFGADRPSFRPTTKKLLHYWLKKSAGYASACGRSSAKTLLPFMDTRDTVQDMESLRVAYQNQLGAFSSKRAALDKLNYYGFSYGTYLGTVYATLYPSKVGRFVLDGVVDPATYWYQSNFDQSIGFNRNINVFFDWMAKYHKVFHLGTNGKKIRRGFNAELKKLRKHPSAKGRLGPDELTDAMLDAGYYVFDWVEIGKAYSKLIRTGRGAGLYGMYASGNQGADNDNEFAVYNAVQCTDQKRPPLAQQLRQTRQVFKKAPFLAWDNTWYNMPCLTWPAAARGEVKVNGAALSALGTKILLISETKDAATPYSGALDVRSSFTTASLIAGVNGTTHAGSLFGVACTDDTVATYLATGVVPTRKAGRTSDRDCPPNPQPVPTSGGSRVAARTAAGDPGMPESLRADLARAQELTLR